jgi:hypothetical protein
MRHREPPPASEIILAASTKMGWMPLAASSDILTASKATFVAPRILKLENNALTWIFLPRLQENAGKISWGRTPRPPVNGLRALRRHMPPGTSYRCAPKYTRRHPHFTGKISGSETPEVWTGLIVPLKNGTVCQGCVGHGVLTQDWILHSEKNVRSFNLGTTRSEVTHRAAETSRHDHHHRT